jgi:DNA gyrase subunit A
MLVTDQGKLIRMPVKDIRIAGRATMGVTLFKVNDAEHVVSAARIRESDDEDGGSEEGTADAVEAQEPTPE